MLSNEIMQINVIIACQYPQQLLSCFNIEIYNLFQKNEESCKYHAGKGQGHGFLSFNIDFEENLLHARKTEMPRKTENGKRNVLLYCSFVMQN